MAAVLWAARPGGRKAQPPAAVLWAARPGGRKAQPPAAVLWAARPGGRKAQPPAAATRGCRLRLADPAGAPVDAVSAFFGDLLAARRSEGRRRFLWLEDVSG